jgi:hypothetical protein
MKRVITLLFALTLITGFASNTSYAQTGFNAVLEYCTGTWCQYCPCGETIIDGIKVNYPNTMVLGYHGPNGYGDPWSSTGQPMITYFGMNSYPSGIVNRKDSIVSYGAWNNKVVISSNVFQPTISYAINNYNYNAGTHTITGNIVSTALSNLTGTYYIMMVLTEDNLVYNQTGSTGCPGSATWVHKYVVRGLLNGTSGTMLPTSDTWTNGTSVTTPLNYTLPAGTVDANCVLNIFIYQQGVNQFNSVIQQSKFFGATTGPTGIQNQNQVAQEFSLSQNYPNPFNPTTNIHFSIPKDGNVSLKIYDMLGKEVETYSDGFMKAGTYNAEVDASSWASGIYFYTLKSDNFVETKKMTLIK